MRMRDGIPGGSRHSGALRLRRRRSANAIGTAFVSSVPVRAVSIPGTVPAGSIERGHRGNVRVNLTFKPAVGEAIREWVNVPLVNRN